MARPRPVPSIKNIFENTKSLSWISPHHRFCSHCPITINEYSATVKLWNAKESFDSPGTWLSALTWRAPRINQFQNSINDASALVPLWMGEFGHMSAKCSLFWSKIWTKTPGSSLFICFTAKFANKIVSSFNNFSTESSQEIFRDDATLSYLPFFLDLVEISPFALFLPAISVVKYVRATIQY